MKEARKTFLEGFFRNRHKDLLRYLKLRVRSHEEAEDIAQEAYFRLLRVEPRDLIANPQAYLYRIAFNVACERRLASARWGEVHYEDGCEADETAGIADMEAQIDRENQLARLDRALSRLSPKCRAAFILHRREGLTYEEVAERLGVSSSMVKKYLARALAQCHRSPSNG